MEKVLIYNEGGINWAWFTRLALHKDNTVTILWHDRRHKGDDWSEELLYATHHPGIYHDSRWREDTHRVATDYYVPGIGWCKIRNPRYIFSYK